MIDFLGQFGPLILLLGWIARGVWIYRATPPALRDD
jgi:hypothetical protein